MYWLKTIACRLAVFTVTVIVGGLISATLTRYAPGFGVDEQQLDTRLSSESIRVLRDTSANERGVVSYYVGSIGRMLKGDLGNSRSFQRPVRELLVERSAVTVRMVGTGLAVAWLLSMILVAITWLLGSRAFDAMCTVGSGSLLCLPAGVIALLLVLLNGQGYVALALVVSPKVHRYLSELVRATARMTHILAARARGFPREGCWHGMWRPLSLARCLRWEEYRLPWRSVPQSQWSRFAAYQVSVNWRGRLPWPATYHC